MTLTIAQLKVNVNVVLKVFENFLSTGFESCGSNLILFKASSKESFFIEESKYI